jgi:5-methylcytosine-specific restriction endonuclease McrA
MSYRPDQLNNDRWRAMRPFIAQSAAFRCEHCHKFLGMTGHVDHIVPRSDCEDMGIHVYDPSNCQYLCASCHNSKSNRERWARVEPTKRRAKDAFRRVRVKGREEFLQAAGIQTEERLGPNVEISNDPP